MLTAEQWTELQEFEAVAKDAKRARQDLVRLHEKLRRFGSTSIFAEKATFAWLCDCLRKVENTYAITQDEYSKRPA